MKPSERISELADTPLCSPTSGYHTGRLVKATLAYLDEQRATGHVPPWDGSHPPPAQPVPCVTHVLITLACKHCENSSISTVTGMSGALAVGEHMARYFEHHSRCTKLAQPVAADPACGCDESKALRREIEALRGRLARIEGGA